MQAIKKQWFTLLLMIIQAVIIIFIQPEIGSVSLCNLMFIAIFAEDERNVFLKLAWEDKFYFLCAMHCHVFDDADLWTYPCTGSWFRIYYSNNEGI